MANKRAYTLRKTVIWLTVLVCLYEAFAKGWESLLLLPLSLVVLPLYVGLQYAAIRNEKAPRGKLIMLTASLLTVFLLASYVCTVGIDDTDQALLFGFHTASDTSFAARLSGAVSTISYVLAGVAFLVLAGLLIANRNSKQKRLR